MGVGMVAVVAGEAAEEAVATLEERVCRPGCAARSGSGTPTNLAMLRPRAAPVGQSASSATTPDNPLRVRRHRPWAGGSSDRQQCFDLASQVSPVATKSPHTLQLAGLCPAGDCLRVDPEQLRHLGRREGEARCRRQRTCPVLRQPQATSSGEDECPDMGSFLLF